MIWRVIFLKATSQTHFYPRNTDASMLILGSTDISCGAFCRFPDWTELTFPQDFAQADSIMFFIRTWIQPLGKVTKLIISCLHASLGLLFPDLRISVFACLLFPACCLVIGSFLLNLETLQGASDARVLWSLWRLLQRIGIIWRLLIRQRSWEAAGQQEKSGISKANRCATVLPAYAINPKSPTVDEDALFWWHADVSLVRFQLDFGDFDFVQSQLGWKRQDNDRYNRVTQKEKPHTSYKFQHNLQLFKHQFSCFFNRKLTQYTFFPPYRVSLFFFVPASWRGRGIWLPNGSIHMHNRWVQECRGRPAASGVQQTVEIIQYPLTSLLFPPLPTLFFSTLVEKPFLSLSAHERIKTLLADELSASALYCGNKPRASCTAPLSFSMKTELGPGFIWFHNFGRQ